MDLSHITSHSLRRVLNLTERKDELIALIAEIETEISKALSGAVAPAAKAPAKKAAPARKARKKTKKPSPLKSRILSLLATAGPKGLRVKDIAAKLGLPGGNISVWISTTGKKLVSKVGPGVYAVKDSKPAVAVSAKPATAKRAAKAAKKPVAPVKKAFKLSKPKGTK
jgi:hypothetical protein